MAEPARHLHVVDDDTGEILPECPECADRAKVISELERKQRGLLLQLANLRADREAEARAHEAWPKAQALHALWREKCSHPRCKFTAETFWLIEPYLRSDGEDLCRRAILGAAYDPFVTTRKNGSSKRHDGWELVFRSRSKFEEFCNRAPRA